MKNPIAIFGILLVTYFQAMSTNKEAEESCEPMSSKLSSLRKSVATLGKLVETFICNFETTQVATSTEKSINQVASSAAGQLISTDACSSDFEPALDKSNKLVVCNIRLEDFRQSSTFSLNNLDFKLCTHVLLSGFFKVNSETVEFTENKLDTMNLSTIAGTLKSSNIKVWLSIGADGTLEPEEYSNFTKSEKLRSKFVENVMAIVNNFALDGFSPRWRYPACPYENCYKFRKGDTQNFELLMNSLSKNLRPKALSLVVYTTKSFMYKTMFDLASLNKFTDYWLIVCYNVEGNWAKQASIATSVDFFERCLNGYLAQIPKENTILGVTAFNNPAKLVNAKANKLGSGIKKDVAGNPSLSTFRNLCTEISKGAGLLVYNESNVINTYWTQGLDWVSFESTSTVRRKMATVTKLNLGGAFLEHIPDDDFDGVSCKCGKYPILRTINEAVRGQGLCFVPSCPTSKP
ncbi:probable chitinase 10 isoform X1 [Cloeon dipterum]|uniref:probable chitinase 10 isoform X1 n=1 Tax=Cloeon dipterum TaxID=197152 RepID=UPI00321FD13A